MTGRHGGRRLPPQSLGSPVLKHTVSFGLAVHLPGFATRHGTSTPACSPAPPVETVDAFHVTADRDERPVAIARGQRAHPVAQAILRRIVEAATQTDRTSAPPRPESIGPMNAPPCSMTTGRASASRRRRSEVRSVVAPDTCIGV